MPRSVLADTQLHPAIRERVATHHESIVREVQRAISDHPTVVVGMSVNPSCKRVRRFLDENDIEHLYLEYGGYTNNWRRRNALKMWTDWPTFPMVFHNGVLIGGAEDTARYAADGGFG